MKQPIIEYDSPVDALVALAKRLSVYEQHYQMDSEEFFDQYRKGQLSDESSWVEWAGDYQHYVAISQQLKRQLKRAA